MELQSLVENLVKTSFERWSNGLGLIEVAHRVRESSRLQIAAATQAESDRTAITMDEMTTVHRDMTTLTPEELETRKTTIIRHCLDTFIDSPILVFMESGEEALELDLTKLARENEHFTESLQQYCDGLSTEEMLQVWDFCLPLLVDKRCIDGAVWERVKTEDNSIRVKLSLSL